MKATLALLAVLVFAQAASARHEAQASVRAQQKQSLQTQIVKHRIWTWQWQDKNAVPRWPTTHAERTASVPYLHRLVKLWHHRHHQAQTSYVSPGGWIGKQIAAATDIARKSSADPWPNCPDPFDGSGASWQDTADCENGGNWMDSPGYFRCGLQFEPSWERVYGKLCP